MKNKRKSTTPEKRPSVQTISAWSEGEDKHILALQVFRWIDKYLDREYAYV